MEFSSILFPATVPSAASADIPAFFLDLNLDQITAQIVGGKEDYKLETFFYTHLTDVRTIRYRQDVMKDLENRHLYNGILQFSYAMIKMREHIKNSKDLHNQYQQDRWFLEAAYVYCNAALDLQALLNLCKYKSEGLTLFDKWLGNYLASEEFRVLRTDVETLRQEFGQIRYSVQIDKDKIVVANDDSNDDYCAEIQSIFKGINEAEDSVDISLFPGVEMNNLEVKILYIIAAEHVGTFKKLDQFYNGHKHFESDRVKNFDREIQFYTSYLAYIERLKENGASFVYPEFSEKKEIKIIGGYDLALARKLLGTGMEVVCNDVILADDERTIILTGPNQGGKTTYARMFGQILYLSALGCPVPCSRATLFLFDQIHTLFPVEEDLSKNSGRLKEELVRLNKQLKNTTPDSVFLVNEFLSSTTSYDAFTLGKRLIDTLTEMDCVCLFITHIFELSSVNKTVSMVADVKTDQNASRTFKILRRDADGSVYINPLIEQYDLTYEKIKERICR